MTITEWKEKTTEIVKGNLTGICIGFLTAPFTHGVSICSNNRNNNGNHNGNNSGINGDDKEPDDCD